jgi:uncharacterized cupredoxin-like copper-binding protein
MMAPILAALVSAGAGFVTDLVKDKGEDLVKKGIEKVTGIDLSKDDITPEQIEVIKANEIKIMELDFEKLKLEFEHKKEDNRHEEVITTNANDNVTERWVSDNKTDSWLAKNVRPLSLLSMLGLIVIIVIAAFFGAVIPDIYIDLVKSLAFLMFGAYFTGRTYEKAKGGE